MNMAKLATILVVVSALLIAWILYWGSGMPLWAVAMSVSMVLVFALLVWVAAPRPSPEALLARELAAMSDVALVQGKVLGVKRLGERETHTLREIRLSLDIALDGIEQSVTLQILVEDTRLPDFSTGSTLHFLQDPRQPERLAIDRRKSPTHIK